MNYTDDEILQILQSSTKIADAAKALNIDTIHQSGTAIIKKLKIYGDRVGFDIDSLRIVGNNRAQKIYMKNPKYCPVCGKLIPFEKRGNKTCSQSCGVVIGNTGRIKSEETKNKISESLYKRKFNLTSDNPIDNLNTFIEHSCDIDTTKYDKIKFFQPCKICGKVYLAYALNPKNNNLQHSKFCSNECKTKNASITSTERAQRRIKDGTFVGWKSRNITSYAENFWKNVLDNNSIPYKREFHFCNKYFLDFYIEKNGHLIDLEIDGKQHEYKDRKIHDIERDEFIKNEGLIVYRVKWNSINSDKGKQLMKEKIDKFLSFYNDI